MVNITPDLATAIVNSILMELDNNSKIALTFKNMTNMEFHLLHQKLIKITMGATTYKYSTPQLNDAQVTREDIPSSFVNEGLKL